MAVRDIYFAWIDPADVFDPLVHNVEDEDVFSLVVEQQEGEFARASVDIVNPREGLLSVTRQQHAFISVDRGSGAELMFKGRLVGFPLDYGTETITLEFLAQPDDWADQQEAFLDTLKTAPEWNELFVAPAERDNPAEVLSARSELLNWDRKLHTVTLTDILEGATDLDLGGGYLFDSLSSTVGDPPLKQVNITVEAQWLQTGKTQFDVADAIRQEFTNSITAEPQINSLTPFAFEGGWVSAKIPSGYVILESALSPTPSDFGLAQGDLRSAVATVSGNDYPTADGSTPASREVTVPRVWYNALLTLEANYAQKRREQVSVSMVVQQQEITLSNQRVQTLSVRLQDPTSTVNGSVLSKKQPSFFTDAGVLSTAGIDAVEHALLMARAKLIKSSRVVETTIEAELDSMLNISLDHNIIIEDDRLPGGSLRGKVIGYRLVVEGDSGNNIGQVTVGSAIGTGDDAVDVELLAEDDSLLVAEDDSFLVADDGAGGTLLKEVDYKNQFGPATMTSAIYYDLTSAPVIDIPVDVPAMELDGTTLINSVVVDNDGESQNTGFASTAFPDVFLQDNRTGVTVDLTSMNPESELFAQVNVTVNDFTIPKHVDLEA